MDIYIKANGYTLTVPRSNFLAVKFDGDTMLLEAYNEKNALTIQTLCNALLQSELAFGVAVRCPDDENKYYAVEIPTKYVSMV